MEFPELVSEKKHLNNLFYLRELTKLRIDNWVEDNMNGSLMDEDYVIERLEDLDLIDSCISNLYSKIRFLEKKTDE